MSQLIANTRKDQSLAAGETLVLTFTDLGYFEKATGLLTATLEEGASLAVTVQVQPEAGGDWFDVKVVDLTGTSTSALVASVAIAATCADAIFALLYPAQAVRVNIAATGADATLDFFLLTSG